MRARKTSGGLTVNAVAGTHVVGLGLDLDQQHRKTCLGFAIQRTDHTEDERYWLTGMKTFEATDPGLGPGGQVSSREHPFQTFQWADYSAKPSHTYTYRVIGLTGRPDALKEAFEVSVKIDTEPEVGPSHSVFFNRGAIACQEYARRFQDKKPSELKGGEQTAAYRWLSRGLLEALEAFLDRAADQRWEVYAAIYEFQWPEALAAFRRAHLRKAEVHVLYDGIHDPTKKGGSTTKKNEAAITKAKVEGLCEPRTTGSIMHNKFVVLVKDKKPVAVWTGSTNLTENGIFGHSNVGHIVEGKAVAAQYLAYWKELRTSPESKDEKAWMGEHNPAPPDPADPVEDLDIVFSPHQGNDVLDWYADIAKGAKDALFMSFAFGMDERFQEAYRQDDDKLRIALMEDFGGTTKEQKAKAKAAITAIRKRRNVVVAVGNRLRLNSFDRWLAERGGLTNNVEWIHTKYMLVDPLGKDPVVITGSANFSTPSTSSNNENMLVIRGNTRVADIYLGEYMRLYNHYAFREMVQRAVDEKVPVGTPQYLVPGAGWQDDYFVPGARSLRRRYFADGKLS